MRARVVILAAFGAAAIGTAALVGAPAPSDDERPDSIADAGLAERSGKGPAAGPKDAELVDPPNPDLALRGDAAGPLPAIAETPDAARGLAPTLVSMPVAETGDCITTRTSDVRAHIAERAADGGSGYPAELDAVKPNLRLFLCPLRLTDGARAVAVMSGEPSEIQVNFVGFGEEVLSLPGLHFPAA